MTSNGIALHRKLPQLVANGLTHLNLRHVNRMPISTFAYLTSRLTVWTPWIRSSLKS